MGSSLADPRAARLRWTVLAIASTAVAYATPVPDIGWNQGSHYALVQALDHGTARVDRFRGQTGDVAWSNGHFYSTKAPGMALAALPAYAALQATGAERAISRHTATTWRAARITIWALHLWAVVVPAVILLVLVRGLGERIEPGMGTAAALTLGLGTLMLPFSTVFFSHVLSACLGFGAFVLLWRDRRHRPGLWSVFAAGALVGLAVTTEYSLAIVAAALALYATIGRTRLVARSAAYAAGAALGVAPLAVYNRLAFGSFRHLSYAHAVSRRGASGHAELGANTTGFFGVGLPSPRVAAELLFASRGVLTLAPVLALSIVGLVPLYRRGFRAEALTICLVALGFLVFNAGYFLPFGGSVPGPRLLVPALPFAVLPLAITYRQHPGWTVGLAAASVTTLLIATVTLPLLPGDDTSRWFTLLKDGRFQENAASFGTDRSSWTSVLPLVLPILAAVAFGVHATARVQIDRRDAGTGLVILLVWCASASLMPRFGHPPGLGAVALVCCAAGVGAATLGLVMAASRLAAGQARREQLSLRRRRASPLQLRSPAGARRARTPHRVSRRRG